MKKTAIGCDINEKTFYYCSYYPTGSLKNTFHMKNVLLPALLLIAFASCAQSNVTIDTCIGDTYSRPSTNYLNEVFSPSQLFLERKYDWTNSTVNCHINKAVAFYKDAQTEASKFKTKIFLGGFLMYPGLALMIVGAASQGTAPRLLPLGLLSFGSGALISFSNKKKIKLNIEHDNSEMQYHINEVRKYYKEKGW
jgi:hypothetical protein